MSLRLPVLVYMDISWQTSPAYRDIREGSNVRVLWHRSYDSAGAAAFFCSFSFSMRSRRSSLRLAISAAFSSFDIGLMARSFSGSVGAGEGTGVGRALDAGENVATLGRILRLDSGLLWGLTLVGERTEPQSATFDGENPRPGLIAGLGLGPAMGGALSNAPQSPSAKASHKASFVQDPLSSVDASSSTCAVMESIFALFLPSCKPFDCDDPGETPVTVCVVPAADEIATSGSALLEIVLWRSFGASFLPMEVIAHDARVPAAPVAELTILVWLNDPGIDPSTLVPSPSVSTVSG